MEKEAPRSALVNCWRASKEPSGVPLHVLFRASWDFSLTQITEGPWEALTEGSCGVGGSLLSWFPSRPPSPSLFPSVPCPASSFPFSSSVPLPCRAVGTVTCPGSPRESQG